MKFTIFFDQLKHQRLLLYPELMDRSVVVFLWEKLLHNTGWKVDIPLQNLKSHE